ncbi:DUF4349 domain-containing protein [Stenotrophomonas sp.]|uniref:DUF4349 domain-containing protein n=1 Tax=Stenotrophomonas sp. TaxID=69392 RepID=UPI002FC73C24
MNRMIWRPRGALAGMLVLVLVLALAGCGKSAGAPEGAAGGTGAVASPEGAALAYEHDIDIQLDASAIGARVKAIAEACQTARFGDCAVLQVGQQGGEYPTGSVRVRIAPKGVEPIIGLAGQGGEVSSRNTHAEDLAQQVADTALTQARLKKEHERLLAYQDGKDVKMADLLVITQRLSEIEAGVEQANKEAAQQRRRIDTQLVTMQFHTPSGQRSRSEIGEALRESGAILTSSVAFVIRAVAALVPVALVLWLFGWIGMKLWRRRRRRNAHAG